MVCTCLDVTDRVQALPDSNEARILESSEAIMRQVRRMTALVDGLEGASRVRPDAGSGQVPEQ